MVPRSERTWVILFFIASVAIRMVYCAMSSGLGQPPPRYREYIIAGERLLQQVTLVSPLLQDDDASQKEIFGPVITVQTFETEDEALAAANGVEYGLASSVWTTNHGTAGRFARDLDFGCVWINTHIPLVAEMPHGGYKHSGYGKDLSMFAFEEYTRIKHVMSYIGE